MLKETHNSRQILAKAIVEKQFTNLLFVNALQGSKNV